MKTAIEMAEELEANGQWVSFSGNNETFIEHIKSVIEKSGEEVAKSVCRMLKNNVEKTQIELTCETFKKAGLLEEFKKFWNEKQPKNFWEIVKEFGEMHSEKLYVREDK